MITPASPARPDEHIVNTAGRIGNDKLFLPDLASWIEATLDVKRSNDAHCTPDKLFLTITLIIPLS